MNTLELSPLRAVSSQSILLQRDVQACLLRLKSAPREETPGIFSNLADHTSLCVHALQDNLSAIAEETASVEVAQQAMHALSHSTVLQRVWTDAEQFIAASTLREAEAERKHANEMAEMRARMEARIAALEAKVVSLTPEPLPAVDDEDSDADSSDADDSNDSGGIVGRYTLDARDRNRRRQYSDTDSRLGAIHSALLKVHESEVAEEQTMRSRLEMRQELAAKDRTKSKTRRAAGGTSGSGRAGGATGDGSSGLQPPTAEITMTPAARHVMLESFMKMLTKVDERCRVSMLEELFMSFKGTHRVHALAGMLAQVSRLSRQYLLSDVLVDMRIDARREFVRTLIDVCEDESTLEILLEKICSLVSNKKRRVMLHSQIDTLGNADLLALIEDLIAESLPERQRLALVDNLSAYLSPGEKRECVLNMIFGIRIENTGSGYEEGEVLTLRQSGISDETSVEVVGVGPGGAIARVSLRGNAGKSHASGVANSFGGGNGDATFVLAPSSKSAQRSMLQRLALVLPEVQKFLQK